jgi:hypothetical protein
MSAQPLYQPGTNQIAAPTGAEHVAVDSGGATSAYLTSAQIAGLSGNGVTTDIVSTSITTVGNGVLTAAGLLGGLILRTGPTAAFTDTTDSAANISAAVGSFVSGATFFSTIKNLTAFPQTLTAGAGVTLPGTNIIGPFEEGQYYGVFGGTAAAPTVTFSHILTTAISLSPTVVSPQSTALNTVGAGTITAAGINGGLTARGGVQTAGFADTTDTAANIIAGNPGLLSKIGASFLYTYNNTTIWPATVGGGAGVTVSGIATVPANGWATYLVTYTAANTITMVGIAQGHFAHSGTFVANGATAVVVAAPSLTANSTVTFGINTIGGTPAGAPFMSAATPGTGFSVKVAAGDTSTYNYTIWG